MNATSTKLRRLGALSRHSILGLGLVTVAGTALLRLATLDRTADRLAYRDRALASSPQRVATPKAPPAYRESRSLTAAVVSRVPGVWNRACFAAGNQARIRFAPPEPGMRPIYRKVVGRGEEARTYEKWYDPQRHRMISGVRQPDGTILEERKIELQPGQVRPVIHPLLERRLAMLGPGERIGVELALALSSAPGRLPGRSRGEGLPGRSAEILLAEAPDWIERFLSKRAVLDELEFAADRVDDIVPWSNHVRVELTALEIRLLEGHPRVAAMRLAARPRPAALREPSTNEYLLQALEETGMRRVQLSGESGDCYPSALAVWERGNPVLDRTRSQPSLVVQGRFRRAPSSIDLFPANNIRSWHPTLVAETAASFDLQAFLFDLTYGESQNSGDALSLGLEIPTDFVAVNRSEIQWVDPGEDDTEEQKQAVWATNGEISAEDRELDLFAARFPRVQFSFCAGNGGYDQEFKGEDGKTKLWRAAGGMYVLWHGFNAIKVGDSSPKRVFDPIRREWITAAYSSWRNPITPHGDRELPEICAPSHGTGTSFASPQVAGTLSFLHRYDGSLGDPEDTRAVLFASAWENRLDLDPQGRPRKWIRDVQAGVDRRCGVGELNVPAALEIVKERSRGKWWDGAWRENGWLHGWIDLRKDGSLPELDTRIRIPGTGSVQIRAALAWSLVPRPDYTWREADPYQGYDHQDLDLTLLSERGSIRASSATWDNNYELIEAEVERGSTYTLRVIGKKNDHPHLVHLGLAWSTREAD